MTTAAPVPTLFCHEDNVREFNAALREQPDIRDFAIALHKAGLIDGLRGARLRPAGTEPAEVGVTPVLSFEAEKRLADRAWKRAHGGK